MSDERHHCPPWCHECPDIEAIVRRTGEEPGPLDIMPFCTGGGQGGLASCYCSHEDPHLDADVVARAQWFAEERIRAFNRASALRAGDELRGRRRTKRPA